MEKIIIFFYFYLIINKYFMVNCAMTIFPDNISKGDRIFNNSQVFGKTNERFYYFLGYFTDNNSNAKYYSQKYGVTFEPVNIPSIVDHYNRNYIFVDYIIKNKFSTREKSQNYFEEIGLFEHVIGGTKMTTSSQLKVIHDINLRITYTIPVISIVDNTFLLYVDDDTNTNNKICEVSLKGYELKIIQIDIKTQIEDILNHEITMVFTCTDAVKNVYLKFSGNRYLNFIYKGTAGRIYLSNFRITVEDLVSKTGIKYNSLLDRSKVGLKTDQSCQSSEDCFKGHICILGFCNPCHYSCIDCFQEYSVSTSKSSCKKCDALTINPEPEDGICTLNYIDISQFKDINVQIIPNGNEYNERATIGLWLFFSDLTNSRSLENDIYHIVLEDRMVISIVPGDNVLTAYCHAYEDLYRKITSDTTLHSSYSDKSSEYVVSDVIPSEDQLGKMDVESMNGKWFHISCGLSYDHKEFYLKSVVNGEMKTQPKTLKTEKLYPGSGVADDGINDVYFNHIINEGEYLILRLKNFGNSNAKIYARHLMFFKDYIPMQLNYMYFDFKQNVNQANAYREVMYQIPFDELFIEPYQVKGYQYDGNIIVENDISLELSHYDTVDFKPPLNFYRLLLNEPNKKYTQIDFKVDRFGNKVTSLTTSKTNYKYLFDDDKILNCQSPYYFYDNDKENFPKDPTKAECIKPCKDQNYVPFQGITGGTGMCDYSCQNDLLCDNDDYTSSTYVYTTFCKSNLNLFYKCVPKEKNYYLQFSGFYNTQTIQFNLEKPLKSYIIEFWFYPDFFLRANARKPQFNYPTYTKNFFFHSNVIDCYFSQTDRLVPYIYDSYKIIKINTLYNSNEWNKFVIYGKYYSETQDYVKTVYVNHAFDQPFSFDISKKNKAAELENIIFCENKCQDINSDNIHWTTGYYRDLRIWDGDMASYSVVVQYDDFFPIDFYTRRVFSILYYFPFSNEYIANNKIRDPNPRYTGFESFTIKTGDYYLKKYNYGYKFDIIAGNDKLKYYSQHASDPDFISDCDIGCIRCWERTFCYKCDANYFLSGRKCLPISNYYFRTPNGSGNDVEIIYPQENEGVTFSFWTKPIGFEAQKQLMITIGNNNPLKLSYSSLLDDPIYGFYLSYVDETNRDKIIGHESEFRDNIGKWTFISVAYHKEEKTSSGTVFFPRMIKFEINTNSIETNIGMITDDPTFKKVIINKGYFGLFVGMKYYMKYLIQAITYEITNPPNIISPFSVPEIQNENGGSQIGLFCSAGKYQDRLCVPDEPPDVGLFVDTCRLYKDTLSTEDSCMNSCSGSGWTRCTCSSINENSQMIFKNNNKNLCRPLDYINFSKMQPLSITGLQNASNEKKFTMQFWIYAYPYRDNIFQGVTFNWSNHNKIRVYLNSGKYNFECSANGKILNAEIETKKWYFLSCAVDYQDNHKIYLNYNTQDDEIHLEQEDISAFTIPNEPTTLTITDDTTGFDDWGYLFFRQIRLWKDAYFNAGFLSRILIETPAKFDRLLHSWEPTFKGNIGDNYEINQEVEDIVKFVRLKVIYQANYHSRYGMNVIDEDYYSILTMCSEDGLYFDVTLKRCLQFIDLSKMKDFTFKDLPSAYSGNYAMAFWVFFEECNQYSENGLHLKWSRHLQITLIKKDRLTAVCFPQGYYSDYVENDDKNQFNIKYTNSLNKAQVEAVDAGTSEDGVWIWVICSVSYYDRKFFLQSNNNYEESIINTEKLTSEPGSPPTSYPMRFYLSDLSNRVMYKSTLSIININDKRKLYLREILLFRNFIPRWYSDKFKYMNMRMLTDYELPALLFVANFADFNLDTKNLKYIIFERQYGSTGFERIDTSMTLSVRNAGSTFELSANFKFQPLCDLSTLDFKKYDVNTEICVRMDDCILKDIHATYCMDENTPLSCQAGYIFTLDSITSSVTYNKILCTSECITEESLTPGTQKDRGICNTNCPAECKGQNFGKCPTTATTMACDDDHYRIGYKCIPKAKDEVSALFFSKCYNSPNFYRTISTSTLSQINSGYFYEFWIKIDKSLNTCADGASSTKEYYLYSTPHSIYKEVEYYYYQVINSAYKIQLTGIDETKWNKIVLETTIATAGQSVNVHINFEKNYFSIVGISTATTMRLQYISFCSRKSNGDCIPGSSNIMWGSAYYRNIRVWDKRSSSIFTIQDFNNGMYSEIPKSLVLFYPLTIRYIDNNVIKEIISGTDSITVTHLYSNNFQTDDDVINYNYELNLDWHLKYECPVLASGDDPKDKELLVKEDCKKVTGYYLKVPSDTTVSFDITAINNLAYEAYTFCIYMKFIGIVKTSTSAQPIILSFKDDTFIVYDIATSYLIFYIGGSEVEAFRDTNFHAYIGVWIPICIANLRSKDTYIHPHMITLSVNKIDIPFTSGYSIVRDGIHISRIALGNEIIAYFADFRVYSRFIQGNFGTIISKVSRNDDIIIHYTLKCNDDRTTDCSVDATFTDGIMKPCCVGDYNIYEDGAKWCNNNDMYFDTGFTVDNKYCDNCNEYCKTMCYNSKNGECTCDMTETVYWLRKNKATSKTYCDHPPYIDYSLLNDINIVVPSSSTNESSIEFWFFIYSYNTTNVNFKEINIGWDLHNRVQIKNEKNSLSAICYALWDHSDDSKWSDLIQTISVTAFGWTLIRCGSDINVPTFRHFFNTYEKVIKTEVLPYDRSDSPSNLYIYNNPLSSPSYGFLFIRELKLWQQYNAQYIDTSYIYLSTYDLYRTENHKSDGKYPGLISLIRSEFNIDKYSEAMNGEYYITNLIIDENDAIYPRETILTRKNDNYIGYNLVDPTNGGYYKTLTLCEEGWVYNSLYDYCEQPSYTKCYFAGDTKDTCVQCPEDSIYIHPIDGLCKSECPTGYYKRDDMNQCRPCEATCYKCDWMFEFNCTECIGDRYLVRSEKRCVLRCEDYNLTASNITNNLCTAFDADAVLVNYEEYVPIDINTFEKLVAKVTNYTSRDYSVLWGFEPELTRKANNNNSMTFPKESPFIGDLTKEEEVLVDNTFFELAKDYIVSLTVIARNILYYEAQVNVTIYFHLRMNSYPVNGTLTIFPSTGLYRITYFVIRCENWEDDTSETQNLEYRFYAQEENTATVNILRGWSWENEIATNFSVIYYQQDFSRIKIFCEIRDELNATATKTEVITIAKSLTGGFYDLGQALENYALPPEEEKSSRVYDVLLYHRSQYLLSLAIDAYKTVFPSFLQTKFESTLEGDEIVMEDPSCVSEYCNGNGDCVLVDEFIICHCDRNDDGTEKWTGKYCHIDQRTQDNRHILQEKFIELYEQVMGNLESSISWYEFMVVYNLYKGASLFFENTLFFSSSLDTFLDYAMKTFADSINNNTIEYLELIDFYYSFEMMRMEKLKTDIQYQSNNFERNVTFSESQMTEFKTVFDYLNTELYTFMRTLANLNAITRRSITFTSENYYLACIPVNPSFDDKKFFEDRKKIYKTYVDFMSCLNHVEMDRLSNPYYQAYFIYIDYNYFPFSYNTTLIVNNSSPMVEIRFVDSTTGKFITVTGCDGDYALVLHMPFGSYRYLDEFNFQKLLYDPNIYKGPDDPIFSDPIYINESGFVSNDTIEQRIEKYSRRYNISPRYFDEYYKDFSLEGITYVNFTNDLNFIEFTSSHLCRFTNFLIPNNATYHPNGRFFYLFRPRILKWMANYFQAVGSLIILGSLLLYFLLIIICICYDRQFTTKEDLLDYIKKEIVKNFYPYAKNKDFILEKLIPTKMNVDFNPENKFGPNAKQTTNRNLATLEDDDLNNEKRIVFKNKRNELMSEGEEDKFSGETGRTGRKLNKKKDRKRMNNFLNEKPNLKSKKKEEENKKNNNIDDYASEIDREIGNVNRATFSINYLPKDFEKSKEEKERRIANYANLKLTSGQFFSANYKLRSILNNAICNVSLFHPRWKKLTMLVTEIGLMVLVISILLTLDESARLSNLIKIGYMFGYALAASTFSNLCMYFIALFFQFPQDLARRLYKLVLFNGQLIVLREWDEISHKQGMRAIPGVIFCVIFWIISLYIGLGFTAVWHDQKFEFLITFGFAFVLNFFVMEIIVEGIIAIFYIGRKKYNCIKRFGAELNRLRNFRCLSP